MVQYSFPGKVVLVTGSSRGIGAAIIEAFARAGATCIVNYFSDADGQNRRDAEHTAARLKEYQVPVHIAVLFFASEETGYITGQTLPITGGWF
jgi:NAD(P)-dependent dehydrogenase (short-subunit alcohol dehydrogenase family)